MAGVSLATPAASKPAELFAYKFVMTPEEGRRDATIEKQYTSRFAACQRRAIATRENEACFAAEFVRQDRELNQVWRLTLGRVALRLRGRLIARQRNWIAGRDPFCREKADEFRGGTIVPVMYMDCRVEQTIRRTMWLEQLR